MTAYVSTTPGLFPLPDWAKDELSNLKGHQKHDLVSGDEGEEITAAYADARAEVIDLQTEAGLDLVLEGQLRWDDMLAHPLAVHDAVDTRGIVRYYDNNNFYREPVVTDTLDFSGDVAAELEAARTQTDRLQAVFPGPYSLSKLATNEYYSSETTFLSAVTDFVVGEIEAFPSHETLFLLEPSLVVEPPSDDSLARQVSESIDAASNATDADVVVHTYWGALDETVHAHLLDADVDAVGYDFVTDPEESLRLVQEYGTKDTVALGLVDGQNTLIEEVDAVRNRVDWVLDQLHVATFDDVYLTTNTETFYLPYDTLVQKLRILAEAAAHHEVKPT